MGHLDSQRSLPALGPDKTGFSPLAKKLRMAPQHQVAVLNAPDPYLDLLRPGPAAIVTSLPPNQAFAVVVLFVNSAEELSRLGPEAIRAAKQSGLLWIAYPKGGQTTGATDLPATPSWVRRDVLGELTGEAGYKPVAFVAVDDVWTALRFKRI